MEFEEFVRAIPPFTKFFIGSVLALSVITAIGIVSPYSLLLFWDSVIYKFHFWRIFTTYLFAGGISITLLFKLFFM